MLHPMTTFRLPILAVLTIGGLSFTITPGFASNTAEKASAFEAAWNLYEAGKPSHAAFKAVLEDESAPKKDRFNAAYVLGVQSLAKNLGEEALSYLDRADTLLANRPQVDLRKVDTLVFLNRLEEAEVLFGSIQVPENSSESIRKRHMLTKSRLLHAKGESDVAIEVLTHASERYAKDWEPFYLMGLIYESFDIPEDAMRAYERAIANDPKRDPFPGLYAYQRWAALAISTDPNSYNDKRKKTTAIHRYDEFLERAEANRIPEDLVKQATVAVDALRRFGV